jgi:enoyl-CoA hydratase/carnithine racemase
MLQVPSTDHASCGFAQVKRWVFASAGALPRITRTIGKQSAMEMVFTGLAISTREDQYQRFVNDIVESGAAKVVAKAVGFAQSIAANSLEGVIASCRGVVGC